MNIAGIDIGATQLRVAILDEDYNILDVYKTNNDKEISAQENVDKLIDFILDQKEPLNGIGIGCPGPLDLKEGKILNPPNLIGWDNFKIVDYIQNRTNLKTVINNDANVAGLAEALLGSGKGAESVCFIGLSTGLGGAYVYRGELVNGANGNAAEWWNMIVNDDPHCHKSANPGSLNEQSGGNGLTMLASEAYGQPTSPKELFDRFYQNDPKAVEIVNHAAETLAKGIANITCIIDPDIIVVGGSIDHYHPKYLEMALEKAKKFLLKPEALHIEKAVFGDDAGLIGAALLV